MNSGDCQIEEQSKLAVSIAHGFLLDIQIEAAGQSTLG